MRSCHERGEGADSADVLDLTCLSTKHFTRATCDVHLFSQYILENNLSRGLFVLMDVVYIRTVGPYKQIVVTIHSHPDSNARSHAIARALRSPSHEKTLRLWTDRGRRILKPRCVSYQTIQTLCRAPTKLLSV